MALMCFHAARIDSRMDSNGEIILLSHQDRSKWDAGLIATGNDYMNKAAFGDSLSSYHIEAAIAYEHCSAASFDETNWQKILSYYNMLAVAHPSSVVMLNRLTAVYKVYGTEKILPEIQASPFLKEWEKNYLYHSLMGDIYAGSNTNMASIFYETAISLTKSEAEKKLLRRKLAQL